MEKLKPKPCPCCKEGVDAGVLASTYMGVRCRGCGLELGCWYPDETPDHLVGQGVEAMEQWVLNQMIEAWNLRAESAELYDALKVTLAALERDNWESDQPAIKTARAAIAIVEGKGITEPKRPPIPADVAAQLDHDEEIYGNAFAHFSNGNWKRLDPTKVAIKTEERKP